MDKKEIVLLNSDIAERYKIIDRIHKIILERQKSFKNMVEGVEGMAYQLHNLYGAYEQLFEVIAHFFENQIDGKRYHADLLRRMKAEIQGVRPALISENTWQLLLELQSFFHFFRHAYGEELDLEKIDRVVSIAIKLKETFYQEMESFLEKLD